MGCVAVLGGGRGCGDLSPEAQPELQGKRPGAPWGGPPIFGKWEQRRASSGCSTEGGDAGGWAGGAHADTMPASERGTAEEGPRMGPALPGAWAERQECLGGGGCEKLLVSRAPLEGPLSPCAQLLSGSEVRALGGGARREQGPLPRKGHRGRPSARWGAVGRIAAAQEASWNASRGDGELAGGALSGLRSRAGRGGPRRLLLGGATFSRFCCLKHPR